MNEEDKKVVDLLTKAAAMVADAQRDMMLLYAVVKMYAEHRVDEKQAFLMILEGLDKRRQNDRKGMC